ncbi:MAG: WG repeat-containing protein [Saprospiraceae bacterium]|nr:WG repeat-containing protein [Saprospiraceae bacterium]
MLGRFIYPLCFLLLFNACLAQPGQQATLEELMKLIKKPTFHAPDKALQKKLRIPFLDGDLYGLCDYEGKILLKPQFEDMEMPVLDLPFVVAKRLGEWSLYDMSGKRVLPFTVERQHLIDIQLEYQTFEDNAYVYISKIRDPEPAWLTPLPAPTAPGESGVVEEVKPSTAFRYYYPTAKARMPLEGWFAPDYTAYNVFAQNLPFNNSKFRNSGQPEFIKVMDENRRFTLLDMDGNPVMPPVFNCVPLNLTKILIQNETGLCAVRDLKKGWQTDFVFRDVSATYNPDLCLGEAKVGDKVVKYKIDAMGKVTPLENEYAWLVLDERYSRVGEKSGEYTMKYHLFDEKTGKKVRDLNSFGIEKILGKTGFGVYENNQLVAIETVEGDTVWMPPFRQYSAIGDSLYVFTAGDTVGLANIRNEVLFKTIGGKITHWGSANFIVEKDKKQGLIGSDGRTIVPVAFDRIIPQRSTRLVLVQNNGLWGCYDWNTGKELVPVKYSHMGPNNGIGAGNEIMVGKTWYVVNRDLEVLRQSPDHSILRKSDFNLKNTSAAVQADFEKAQMEDVFWPYVVFDGANMQHVFRSDGQYIASLEGSQNYMVFFGGTRSDEELCPLRFTGIGKLTDATGRKVWVRLEDGKLYKKD